MVTPEQVRSGLATVPQEFLRGLEVVQFSRMTRKKQSFPCYGMQWGSTLYLYPLEETLEEWFTSPPRPEIYNEARMYGGRWDEPAIGSWRLTWTKAAIEDFYLNNILIHELGHLVDDRNSGYTDRERYAEWFALHYGYRATGGRAARRTREGAAAAPREVNAGSGGGVLPVRPAGRFTRCVALSTRTSRKAPTGSAALRRSAAWSMVRP